MSNHCRVSLHPSDVFAVTVTAEATTVKKKEKKSLPNVLACFCPGVWIYWQSHGCYHKKEIKDDIFSQSTPFPVLFQATPPLRTKKLFVGGIHKRKNHLLIKNDERVRGGYGKDETKKSGEVFLAVPHGICRGQCFCSPCSDGWGCAAKGVSRGNRWLRGHGDKFLSRLRICLWGDFRRCTEEGGFESLFFSRVHVQ